MSLSELIPRYMLENLNMYKFRTKGVILLGYELIFIAFQRSLILSHGWENKTIGNRKLW